MFSYILIVFGSLTSVTVIIANCYTGWPCACDIIQMHGIYQWHIKSAVEERVPPVLLLHTRSPLNGAKSLSHHSSALLATAITNCFLAVIHNLYRCLWDSRPLIFPVHNPAPYPLLVRHLWEYKLGFQCNLKEVLAVMQFEWRKSFQKYIIFRRIFNNNMYPVSWCLAIKQQVFRMGNPWSVRFFF